MADNKTSLIEDIKNYTKDISTNTKQFGPKLPSKDETSEHNEEIEESVGDIMTVLIGSFAHLIFGQANKRKFSDLSTLFGQNANNTLFGNIADIAKTIGAKDEVYTNKFGEQIGKNFFKSSDFFKKLTNSISGGLSKFSNDTKIVESINNLSGNIQNCIQTKSENEPNENLLKIVESVNDSAKQIEENVKAQLDKKNDLNILLKGVDNTSSINKLLEALSDKRKYNESEILTKLKFISHIVDKDGELHNILRKINDLNKDITDKKIEESIKGIKYIVDLIINIPSISLIKTLKFAKSIFWIRHIGLDSIYLLIKDIDKWVTEGQEHFKNINEGLKSIGIIFSILDKTLNYGFIKGLKIKFNIKFLETIIENDLSSLIDHIVNLNLTENKLGNIEQNSAISVFIEFLDKLSDKEAIERIKNARKSINNLKRLVKNELADLIQEIKNINIDKETQKFDNITSNIEMLSNLLNVLPGIMQLLKGTIKLNILENIIDSSLTNIIESINKLKTLNKTETYWNSLLTIFNSYLKSIYEAIFNFNGEWLAKVVKTDTIPGIQSISIVINEIEKLKNANIDKNVIISLKEYLKEIETINFSKLPKLTTLSKILDIQGIINNFNESFDKDQFITAEDYNAKIEGLEKLTQDFAENGLIARQINNLININKKHILQIENVIEYCDELSNLAHKIVIIDWLTSKMAQDPKDSGLVKLANALTTAINKFNEININENKLKLLNNGINAFIKLVVVSAAILIFAGAVMLFINPLNITLFAATLGLFTWGLVSIYKFLLQNIKDTFNAAENLALLVFITGFTLALGAALFTTINWKNLAKFIIWESIFFGAIIGIYAWIGKYIQLSLETAQSLAILIITTGATVALGSILFSVINWDDARNFVLWTALFAFAFTLIFVVIKKTEILEESLKGLTDFTVLMFASSIVVVTGSILSRVIKWDDAFRFIGMTALFMATMILAISWPKLLGGGLKLLGKIPHLGWLGEIGSKLKGFDPYKVAFDSAKDFAILIIACGFTMALGAILAKRIGWGDLFKFTVMLELFVGGVVGFLLWIGKGKQLAIAEHTGKEFAKIVIICATTMIIGGLLFTLFPKLEKGVIEFTVIFDIFMLGITGSLYILSKSLSDGNVKDMYKLMGIVVIGAAILLIAGKVMSSDPNMKDNIWNFTAVMVLLIGGIGFITGLLGKNKDKVKKGIPALMAVAVAIGISAIAMKKLAETSLIINSGGGIGTFIGVCTATVVVLGIISAGIVGLAFALGNPVAAAAAYLAIGVVLAGAAAIWIVADGMQKIASALEKLSNVKELDLSKLVKNITSTLDLIDAIKPLISSSKDILMASIALTSLSHMMDKLAESVQNYASLTVPIYDGTKIVGYRHLKDKDFKDASRNISTIITVLGNTITKTYDKNPEIFETDLFGRSKFSIVTKSLRTLAPLISSIAKSVKTYASLTIGDDYKNDPKTGLLLPTTYRKLTSKDFSDAGENVKEIITVLGGAIIDAYDKNTEIFKTDLFGRSKFGMVTKSLKTLAPLISSIAKSVKTYADLKIADYGETVTYDSQGNPKIKKYIPIGKPDFENAAANITHIISTLGGAIIDAYEAHPEYYETSGGFMGFGGSSPFTTTIKANITLAKLISRIGKAVADMSSLNVATEWYTSGENIGKPKKYVQLDKTHFEKAAENILTIMTTLGEPIEKIANGNKFDLYRDTSDSNFLGISGPKSKFIQVIDGNIKLASLISRIGKAVGDMANLHMPIKYNNKGEGTEWRQLNSSDFKTAARNIMTIITTLGTPIEEIAKEPNKLALYKESSGLFGFGSSESPFALVINGNLKLAELITNIGSAIKDMANLQFPTEFDTDGKPRGYKSMDPEDFKKAANCINTIIVTLGKSIIDSYNENKDWFKNGEDSIFSQACTSISSMGNMISQIAGGISAYAQLKIPDWSADVNPDGTPKKYMQLNEQTFIDAAAAINAIVTNIGNTVINTYKEHKTDWFNDNENSDFVIACTAIGHMGEMIGSIAQGVAAYAELKIATKWDPKTGNPSEYKNLNETDFQKAANNISTIISTIGCSIMGLYHGKVWDAKQNKFVPNSSGINANMAKQMFNYDPNSGADSPFNRVIESCTNMGDMITAIAESIQMYASLNMPTGFDKNGKPTGFQKMDETMFGKAATNISTIITTIGTALQNTYKGNETLFNSVPAVKSSVLFGLISTSQSESDSPIVKVINATLQYGKIISAIAKGVQDFAMLRVPTKFNSDGTPNGYETMGDNISNYAKSIKDLLGNDNYGILVVLGNTIKKIYDDHGDLFDNDNVIYNIITSITKMSGAMINIIKAIQGYANFRFPYMIGEDGKPIDFSQESTREKFFTDATTNMGKILSCIPAAIETIGEYKLFKSGKSSSTIKNIVNMYGAIIPVLGNVASIIKLYSSLRVPTKFDSKGKPTDFEVMDDTKITKAGTAIQNVLTAIGNAIITTIKGNEDIFGDSAGFFSKNPNPKASPAYRAALAINEITKPLATMASVLGYYTNNQFPIIKGIDENGKPITEPIEFDKTKVQTNIENVLLSIITPLKNIMTNSEYNDIFAKENNKSKGFLRAVQIQQIANQITAITKEIKNLGDIEITDSTKKLEAIKNTISTMFAEIINIATIFNTPVETLQKYTVDSGFDKNGIKPISASYTSQTLGEYITGIVDKDSFKNTSSGITAITSALENIFLDTASLVEFYKKNESLIKSFVDKTMYNTITSGLDNMIRTMSAIALSLSTFNESYNKIENKDKIREFAFSTFKTFSDSTIEIVKNIYKLTSLNTDHTKIKEKLKNIETFLEITAENYNIFDNDKIKNFINSAKKIIKKSNSFGNIIKNVSLCLQIVFRNIYNLNQSYIKYSESILWLVNSQKEKLLETTVNNITDAINSIIKPFSKISDDIELDDQYKFIRYIIENTNKVFYLIDNLHKNFNQYIAPYTNNENFKGLYNVINACRNAIAMLYDFGGHNTSVIDFGTPLFKQIETIDASMNISDLSRKLDNFNNTVKNLVNIVNYSEETGEEGYKIIMWGLDGIMSTINVIPPQQNFEHNVNLLSRYVSAINRIDLSKIIRLTNLSNSLNLLATKLGNLDNLTDALANNVAVVLDELVRELLHAETTINDAHKLQIRRHQLINESIEKVKEIMDKPMKVEVSKVDDTLSPTKQTTQTSPTISSSDKSTSNNQSYETTASNNQSPLITSADKPGVREPIKTTHVEQFSKPNFEELIPDWAYRKLKPTAFNDQIDSEKAKRLK